MYVSLLNQPNRLFGPFGLLRRELAPAFGASGLPAGIRAVTPGTLPASHVGHTPNSAEVYAFAPALDAAKIEVTLDRGLLQIAGARAQHSRAGACATAQDQPDPTKFQALLWAE